MKSVEALRLLARAEMVPFSASDFDAFSGCVSENPLIGEVDDYLLILDGETLEITDNEGGHCYQFRLTDGLSIY